MGKIKICHFIIGFHICGVEKVIENYFANMDRSKFELHIVTHIEPDLKRQKIFENMGFIIHQLSRVHGHRIKLKNLQEYNEFFKNNKFDIVHNHFPENLLPLYFAKKYGVKARILHSHSNYENAFSKKNSLIKFLYGLGLKANTRNATAYFSCGRTAAIPVFGKKNIEKVIYINNAINTEMYRFNQVNREAMRKKLGMENAFILGHIGRYEVAQQKNQEFVLKVYKEVLEKIPEARLLMIGEGKLRKDVMKQAKNMGIENYVFFTGAVSNVPDYLQAMDVFVFPSRVEGLGIVAVEAQCSGVPVVASDAVPKEAGITELFSALSLDESLEKWADEVISKRDIVRADHVEAVKNAGYEIKLEAKKLENLYEKMYREIFE